MEVPNGNAKSVLLINQIVKSEIREKENCDALDEKGLDLVLEVAAAAVHELLDGPTGTSVPAPLFRAVPAAVPCLEDTEFPVLLTTALLVAGVQIAEIHDLQLGPEIEGAHLSSTTAPLWNAR